MPICSGKYFDLYFTYSGNEYQMIGKSIKEFVSSINKKTSHDDIYYFVLETLERVQLNSQREWLYMLNYHLEEINRDCIYEIGRVLSDKIFSIDNSQEIFIKNAREIVYDIIVNILELVDEASFDTFVDSFIDSFDRVLFIYRIIVIFESKKNKNIESKRKLKRIKNVYTSICEKILNNTINLYEDLYYSRFNIWGLYHYVNNYLNNSSCLAEYMKLVISKANVFRVLGDTISKSTGKEYEYTIKKENLSSICICEEVIDAILINRNPKNESEAFVRDVYEKYKSTEKNGEERRGVISTEEIFLQL